MDSASPTAVRSAARTIGSADAGRSIFPKGTVMAETFGFRSIGGTRFRTTHLPLRVRSPAADRYRHLHRRSAPGESQL